MSVKARRSLDKPTRSARAPKAPHHRIKKLEVAPEPKRRGAPKRRPLQADAVADIEGARPGWLSGELDRIWNDCTEKHTRRVEREIALKKLNDSLDGARVELEIGWSRAFEGFPMSPARLAEIARFDAAAAEIRALVDPFPGETMSVEAMFVRSASLLADDEQIAKKLGTTEANVRRHRGEIAANPSKDGTVISIGRGAESFAVAKKPKRIP